MAMLDLNCLYYQATDSVQARQLTGLKYGELPANERLADKI